MTDEADQHPIDLRKLAEEAADAAYDPRAKRCWPWSHEWTMWVTDQHGRSQDRRCLRCGRKQINVLVTSCAHRWETISENPVFGPESDKRAIGFAYSQKCTECGDLRRKNLYP
jgi:hypothetical protein